MCTEITASPSAISITMGSMIFIFASLRACLTALSQSRRRHIRRRNGKIRSGCAGCHRLRHLRRFRKQGCPGSLGALRQRPSAFSEPGQRAIFTQARCLQICEAAPGHFHACFRCRLRSRRPSRHLSLSLQLLPRPGSVSLPGSLF